MSEQAKELPRLHYIGDAVVGVVSDCRCPGTPRPVLPGVSLVPEHEHESHDIVPPRTEDELPLGVDFEDYTRWCRMFAASADLLAACKAALAYDAAIQKRVIDGAVDLMATGGAVAMGDDLDALYAAWIDAAHAAVAKAEPTTTGA